MQISVTYPSFGAGAPFILGDDTTAPPITTTVFPNGIGGQIKGFLPKPKRFIQQTQLPRAPYMLAIPRYNLQNRCTWTTQRSFSTAAACLGFLLSHGDRIPVSGELYVYHSDSGGTANWYLPNAVLESVEGVNLDGTSCNFTYSFIGNSAWQSTP